MKDKNIKDNLKILVMFFIILSIGIGIIIGSFLFIYGTIYFPGFSSIVVCFIFLIALWFTREISSWKQYGMIMVCFFSVFALLLDYKGNYLYNLPIQWLYRNMGKLTLLNNTQQMGSRFIRYSYQIVNETGSVVKVIHPLAIGIFRLFEYLGIYSILLTIVHPVMSKFKKAIPETSVVIERKWNSWEELQKKELDRQKQIELESMQINSEIKQIIENYVDSGQKIKAIQIILQHSSLSLQEAKDYVDNL